MSDDQEKNIETFLLTAAVGAIFRNGFFVDVLNSLFRQLACCSNGAVRSLLQKVDVRLKLEV